MGMAKKAAMKDMGRKMMVTMVKTMMVWPWRPVKAAWSRAKRASNAFACFCFRSRRWVSC